MSLVFEGKLRRAGMSTAAHRVGNKKGRGQTDERTNGRTDRQAGEASYFEANDTIGLCVSSEWLVGKVSRLKRGFALRRSKQASERARERVRYESSSPLVARRKVKKV